MGPSLLFCHPLLPLRHMRILEDEPDLCPPCAKKKNETNVAALYKTMDKSWTHVKLSKDWLKMDAS